MEAGEWYNQDFFGANITHSVVFAYPEIILGSAVSIYYAIVCLFTLADLIGLLQWLIVDSAGMNAVGITSHSHITGIEWPHRLIYIQFY